MQPLSGGKAAVGKHFADLVTVLERAHGLGIYHRDVKPDNIFLTDKDTIFLNDWSSAYRRPEHCVQNQSIRWIGSAFFTVSAPDSNGCHIPQAADDLLSLVRTVNVMLHNQKIWTVLADMEGYIAKYINGRRFWKEAVEYAATENYEQLRKSFLWM